MLPPQPQFSLPTPKYLSAHGASCPFARRRSAIGETSGLVMYSTQSCISRTVPLPRLPLTYGSQPSCRHSSKNSCAPKELSSTTPPQWELIIFTRDESGPTPSRQ